MDLETSPPFVFLIFIGHFSRSYPSSREAI
jgi:hypothetical protein